MNRLEKNKNIANTMKETYAKRKSQVCKCFKFKIDKSNLSKQQANQLKMMFVEAKWIYNYLLDKAIYHFDYKALSKITHKDKNRKDIETTISYVSSSVKQSIIQNVINQIKGLSVLKKRGHKVGKLKYKTEYNSINLKQYGNTHSIRGSKFKIQGIKKLIRVRGLDQLSKYENIDYANAKLLYDGIDYYIALTCFIDKENVETQYKNDIVGIDMGVSTTITLSDGTKYDISIGESDRLKKLQAKLVSKQKGSNNRYKLIKKIKKEYIHINNKKNDISNKIVHSILNDNKIIVMQDEQLDNWKTTKEEMKALDSNDKRKAKAANVKIQNSVLGRIKSKLIECDRTIVLDKWFPTTKYCSNCGSKVELELNDRIFECPKCKTKEDRDIHAANNMIWFYHKYNKLDRSGTDQTSIKGPVKITYNKFISKLAKQEDTTSRRCVSSFEAKGVSNQIQLLAEYIYKEIETLVNQESDNPTYDNKLYELFKEYGDDYPIEINFSYIKGFNPKKYDLLTYRKMGPDYADYECDMIVNICKYEGYGAMDTGEPLLHINYKPIKTKKSFNKNSSPLMNTLSHELTHYVQHMSNTSNGGHALKDSGGAVSKELIENTQGNMRYYVVNFLLYAINPIESDARKQGFYQTMKFDLEKKIKQYKKEYKTKEVDIEKFCDFAINHKDYDNNILHMGYFNLLLTAFKEDTWENYKKCIDDKENKYRDDSIIYVLLNICDVREHRPYLPMPAKQNLVMNINSEKRFNEYKSKLVKDYTHNLDKYVKKLKKVIRLVIEETKLLN